MDKKIGGWKRLWIVLSAIYFFVVTGTSVYYFSEIKSTIRRERSLATIELVLPIIKEQCIKDAMMPLQQYLIKYFGNVQKCLHGE